jgi:Replication-relaxation
MPAKSDRLQLAKADQLCRLHYKLGSLKAVKAKLRTLCDEGYVQFDCVPTKFTRSPYYYMLTKKGINYLSEAGLDTQTAYRPDKDNDRHALFIDHTLAVDDVIVSAAILKKDLIAKKLQPNYWLESVVHERVIKRQPYRINWKGETITLIPDGILTFRYLVGEQEQPIPIMLEHESSEKGQFAFRRKVRAYIELLKDKFHGHKVRIAYTTTLGTRYLGKMCEWTWQELHATNEPVDLGRAFLFAAIANPTPEKPIDPKKLWLEPVWYSLYDESPVTMFGG